MYLFSNSLWLKEYISILIEPMVFINKTIKMKGKPTKHTPLEIYQQKYITNAF